MYDDDVNDICDVEWQMEQIWKFTSVDSFEKMYEGFMWDKHLHEGARYKMND